jgi:hypothetical protein
MQTWVVMARLPDTSAILIAFRAHVKRNKFDKTNRFDQKSVDKGSRMRVGPWIPTQANYKTAQHHRGGWLCYASRFSASCTAS